MNPLISCIVPVYDGERFLAEALGSIFAQSYRPIEVVVVDDGSTDGTAAVAATCPQPITYIHQENAGAPVARNRGIDAAAGEFIAFLDSDDLWVPQKLALQMARFQSRPELDLCIGHIQNFWMPELAEEEQRWQDHAKSQPLPGYVTGTLLARKRLFQTVGLFSLKLRHGDSVDWFLRARQAGAVEELLPDVLTLRRMHARSTSRFYGACSRQEFLEIVKRNLDRRRASGGKAQAPEC